MSRRYVIIAKLTNKYISIDSCDTLFQESKWKKPLFFPKEWNFNKIFQHDQTCYTNPLNMNTNQFVITNEQNKCGYWVLGTGYTRENFDL